MSESAVEVITTNAVTAALDVIDDELGTNRSPGPCGDALATELHKVIYMAINKHLVLKELFEEAKP